MTRDDLKSTPLFGFTMLEMLVVIAIIGLLASAVLYSVGKARANGDATRCRANLRNLGQAVMNLVNENDGYLPFAGGFEHYNRHDSRYHEKRGWVNWIPKGGGDRPEWPSKESQAEEMTPPTWYGPGGRQAILEGSLWADKEMAPLNMLEFSAYCCPLYKRRKGRDGDVPGRADAVRSYAMNGYFGYYYHGKKEGNALGGDWCSCCAGWPGTGKGVRFSTMDRPASRTLLFCEMWIKSENSDPDHLEVGDQTLTPELEGSKEPIGFYHVIAGKRCGHVVFVDGHVEVIVKQDPDDLHEKNLTLTEEYAEGDI